jgi:polyphosphate kinase
MTANEQIGEDVNEVFKQLTGLGHAGTLTHLWQAPFTLHSNVIAAIRREAGNARARTQGTHHRQDEFTGRGRERSRRFTKPARPASTSI